MARQKQRRRRSTTATTTTKNATTATPKVFGRPRPVVCEEEAGWFDAAAAPAEPVQGEQQAKTYIRRRFHNLLDPEEIETLASNEVMLKIVAQHRELYRTQADNQDAQAA